MAEKTSDANGVILNAKIEEVRVYREMDGGDSNFVLTLTQDGRQYTLPPYSVDNIDRFRIGKSDPRFVALDEDGKATDTRVQAVLKEAISQEIRQGRCGVLLNRTGWVELPNGRYIYNTGMQVIGDTGGIEVKLSDTLPQLELTDQCIEMDDKQLLQSYLRKLSRECPIIVSWRGHVEGTWFDRFWRRCSSGWDSHCGIFCTSLACKALARPRLRTISVCRLLT